MIVQAVMNEDRQGSLAESASWQRPRVWERQTREIHMAAIPWGSLRANIAMAMWEAR